MAQTQYKTKQREIVHDCLVQCAGEYMTVDDVWSYIINAGKHVGRTTVYRTLETLVEQGSVIKAPGVHGQMHYCLSDVSLGEKERGQLICLECGHVRMLDCNMFADMSQHVLKSHDFRIDPSRSVMYGLCSDCNK